MKRFIILLAFFASLFGGVGYAQTVTCPGSSLNICDQYGGDTQITCSGGAKGYFYTQKIGLHWYFCTPLGNAFIAMSVSNIVPNCASTTAANCINTSVTMPEYTANGTNGNAVYATKYAYGTDTAGTSYNWVWQVEKRMTGWGFNSVGQESGNIVAYTTCSGAACNWPSGKNPIPLPFIDEAKPAEHAAYNANGYVTSPVKDMIAGTNTNCLGCYRGGSTYDFFDPSISTEWTHEIPTSSAFTSPYLLAIFTDDSDYFIGTGCGPDFFCGGHQNSNSAFVTLIASPVQTYNRSTAIGSKAILYPNTIVYAKAQATNPSTCSVSSPCSLRDYLWCEYTLCGSRSNATGIADLNAAWGSHYTTFDSSGTQVTGLSPTGCTNSCTGNGSTTTFTMTLPNTPVSPYSVQIFVGGTFEIGDCPQFHSGCGSTSGSGELESPTSGYVTSSTINYSTGAITLTFSVAPASGTAIAVSYIYGGWMAGGTGLMDESGGTGSTTGCPSSGTSTCWVGNNSFCLEGANPSYTTYFACNGEGPAGSCSSLGCAAPNANATLGADLDAWVSEEYAEYFKTMQAGLVAANIKAPYFGLDAMGSWQAPAFSGVIKGEAPYVNGAFSSSMGYNSAANEAQEYQYFTQYLGDLPFMTFNIVTVSPDSSYFSSPSQELVTYSTQALRGNAFYTEVDFKLNTLSHNGDYPVVGVDWWSWQDFQNANQGIVSVLDNAYDGSEPAGTSVACDSSYTVDSGATCGGEVTTSSTFGTWTASTKYYQGICVLASPSNGYYYCNEDTNGTSATSGTTQPPFTSCTTVGCTICSSGCSVTFSDNGITWKNIAIPPTPYGNALTETDGIQAGNLLWLGATPPPAQPIAPSKKAMIWGHVTLPETSQQAAPNP